MNFSQLELICAIQEKGNLSAAAETVGLTQSAASRAISTLEDELGVILVNRTRSGSGLTEIGTHLLPHIYEILTHAEYIRQETAAQRGLSVGKLRIGSIPSMSARLFAQLVGTFQHRYPGIETVVFEGDESEIMSWLQQGIVDVGLIAHPTLESTQIPIAKDELKIIVSQQHRFANGAILHVSDLADEPLIMCKSGCMAYFREIFDDAHVSMNVQLELSDINTVFSMVREGLGITLMAEKSLPEQLADMRVLSFDVPIYRYLHVVTNGKSVSPAAQAFVELAREITGVGIEGAIHESDKASG